MIKNIKVRVDISLKTKKVCVNDNQINLSVKELVVSY